MKLILENTTKTVTMDGVLCRIWEGVTGNGIPCQAYIPRVSVLNFEDATEFDRDLKATRLPSPEAEAIPLRMIL